MVKKLFRTLKFFLKASKEQKLLFIKQMKETLGLI